MDMKIIIKMDWKKMSLMERSKREKQKKRNHSSTIIMMPELYLKHSIIHVNMNLANKLKCFSK
jgi:hypothetical protein